MIYEVRWQNTPYEQGCGFLDHEWTQDPKRVEELISRRAVRLDDQVANGKVPSNKRSDYRVVTIVHRELLFYLSAEEAAVRILQGGSWCNPVQTRVVTV